LLVLIGREIVFPAEHDLEGALKVEDEALECPPVLTENFIRKEHYK
jgi:hypothetical protein